MSHDQASLIQSLRSPDAYPHATTAIRVIETHISWVLLTGEFAYKIKKAVQLPFLDFSTLERRERFCRDELRLNRRLAPEIYRDVVPVGGTAAAPRIGQTPAIEYAVRMLQFPPEATADELIGDGALEPDALTELAQRIADFHASIEPAGEPATREDVIENLDQVESLLDAKHAPEIERISSRLRAAASGTASLRRDRALAGMVRECHGDLHLGNVALIHGRLVPFDCLEFDETLRTIDVIDEAAFLYMDLCAHERPDLASVFVNRYLERNGDYDGLRLLLFYAAHRALVRAKVEMIEQRETPPVTPQARARRYLATAWHAIGGASPVLLITSGLSGSGKSTLARRLAPRLGAMHLRSDIERKRLHGMAPTERSGAALDEGIYARADTDATYAKLLDAAESAIDGRLAIIVDASFLACNRRAAFQALAARHGVPFLILHCVASEGTLRERVRSRAQRNDDPSDAGEAVLDRQLQSADAITSEEEPHELRVVTDGEVDIDGIVETIETRAQVSLSSTSY